MSSIFLIIVSFFYRAVADWDLPLDPIPTAAPTNQTTSELRDSFSPANRGRFGPTQCPDRSQVYSLNITADYSGTLRALSGVSSDLELFNKITSLVSNGPQSRSVAMNASYTKTTLLNYLTQFSRGKPFVNLNFAGHGETIQGKSYILLPGYFNCLKNVRDRQRVVEACSEYLVTGREVEQAMSGTHVFGIITSCQSGDIARDMSKSSMIAGSEPGRDILDDYGQFAEGMVVAELQNSFGGSELAGRMNDLLSREVSCAESLSKDGQVTFADIPALIPKRAFFRDRPSGNNVRDAINTCFVLKPAKPECAQPAIRPSQPATTSR